MTRLLHSLVRLVALTSFIGRCDCLTKISPSRAISRPKETIIFTDARSGATTKLMARSPPKRFSEEPENSEGSRELQARAATDRPTQTLPGQDGPSLVPSRPNIVVLGATGKVGRLVVQQLLEMQVDLTVVAFVRDYDKAIRVLYDDMLVAKSNKNGPKLQIVQGNLVPPEELPGFYVGDTEDEKVWRETAASAAKYFGTKTGEFDNREFLPDINEALQDAIKDCTTVISCVGSTRPTNLWTDVLARPLWRLLRPDVSRWCQDPRHPFYVHYATTRKAVAFAEREQLRREAVAESDDADSPRENSSTVSSKTHPEASIPKIRFIRISDLCVGHKPWHFVPLVTNVFQSIVLRYHEMAENHLAQSNLLETIVLRPGDLVDDERDTNTTALQVSQSGTVPLPAVVGREDVAALAVAAAMFKTPEPDESSSIARRRQGNPSSHVAGFHYTLACRWVGQDLSPFPAQGLKMDGLPDAKSALRRTLQVIDKNTKRQERRLAAIEQKMQRRQPPESMKEMIQVSSSDWMLRMNSTLKNRQRKRPGPHGICAAVPVYLFLGIFGRAMVRSLINVIPGGTTRLAPAISQLQQVLWMAVSGILLKLLSFLPWLTRQKQYISF